MKKFVNNLGAAFDVPEEHKATLVDYISTQSNPEFTIEIAQELPELAEDFPTYVPP